jgi:hypothetical protein
MKGGAVAKKAAKPSAPQKDHKPAPPPTLLPVIGSESAPLIFANGVLNFGATGQVAHLLLYTRRDVNGPQGDIIPRTYVTADLRIPIADLPALRKIIDRILLLVAKPAKPASNDQVQ